MEQRVSRFGSPYASLSGTQTDPIKYENDSRTGSTAYIVIMYQGFDNIHILKYLSDYSIIE